MKSKTRKILSVLIALFLAAGFIYFLNNLNKTEVGQAGAGDNVSGFAWSENIGWISFNNTSGGGGVNYGVNIDPLNGNFSGFAWSENIGWISFSPAGPYPQSPSYSAKLDLVTNQVIGWARACAGTVNGDCASADRTDGWDGWIKMSGTATNGSSYGVSRSGCELTGYAWGSDVVGWIKFKGTAQNGSPSPYGVVTTLCETQPPYVDSPVIEYQDYCQSSPGRGLIGFRWTYRDADGNPETRFDFRVNDVNNVNDSAPEVDRSFSGLNNPDGAVNTQAVLVDISLQADKIVYNTTYYWWIRVWDNQGSNSGWVSGGPSFRTDLHAYPWPDFTHSPQNPSIGEIVNFTDTSVCYDVGGSSYPCKNSPANSYSWDFGDGTATTTRGDTSHDFASVGTYTVRLSITDDIGTCTGQGDSPVGSGLRLPRWKEIPPF